MMGYKQELERKKIRDAKLYKYHLEHPNISYRDLDNIFKISYGRVGQILQKQRELKVGGN